MRVGLRMSVLVIFTVLLSEILHQPKAAEDTRRQSQSTRNPLQ
jgi:hypothetical protein